MLPEDWRVPLERLLVDCKLDAQVIAAVLPLARETIAFEPIPVDDAEVATGRSKLGGAPDVPAGFEWPRWQGKPLHFVAQFACKDLARMDRLKLLPARGLLAFFYESVDQRFGFEDDAEGSYRVHYFEDARAVQRAAIPRDHVVATYRNGPQRQFTTAALKWHRELGLPDDGSKLLKFFAEFPETEQDKYFGMLERLPELHGGSERSSHRILGYSIPRNITSGEPKGWQLLLQLGECPHDVSMSWGNSGGAIYFWIRDEHLAARRFDDVAFDLLCN